MVNRNSGHTVHPDPGPRVSEGDAGAVLGPGGDWRRHAACAGEAPELFFPVSESGPALKQISAAKAVCARCPVRDACLRYALATGQGPGIWGGLTEGERRDLRYRARLAARRAQAVIGQAPRPR